MNRRGMGAVVAGIQTLYSVGTTAALSDGALLERFLTAGDEAAFACLVARHGPMVMRVCRGVLHDAHAAEDAFQVAFLILARKGCSVRDRDSIASWLFGVARRVALRARRQSRKRADHETAAATRIQDRAAAEPPEFHPEIHEEVDRLPDRYRAPVVLCYFEGLTQEQAAIRLALPAGTIKTRLSRARERLKRRLESRGLAPEAFASFASDLVFTSVPSSLVEKTATTAVLVWAGRPAGLSASASALFQGMMKAMLIAQLKTVFAATATVIVGSALVATTLARPVPVQPDPDPKQPPRSPARTKARKTQIPGEATNTVTMKKESVTRTVSFVGTLRAFESVVITPRHSGYLSSLTVDIGSRVKKGQTLAVVQDVDLELAVERAKAVLEQAQVGVEKAKAEMDVAIASLESFKAEHKVDGKAATDPWTTTKQAEAAARVSVAKAALNESQIRVRLAQIDVGKAQTDLRSMTLTAPFDGVVTRRGHHVGEYLLGAGQEKGEPLLRVVKTDVMRCGVMVPENLAANLKIGDQVTIRLVGRPDDYPGKISRIDEAFDHNGRLRAEVDLDNADAHFRDGQQCEADITLQEAADVLLIPRTAIRGYERANHQANCTRLVDGRMVQTPIKVLELDEERFKVYEGLKEGDVVFTVFPLGTQ